MSLKSFVRLVTNPDSVWSFASGKRATVCSSAPAEAPVPSPLRLTKVKMFRGRGKLTSKVARLTVTTPRSAASSDGS